VCDLTHLVHLLLTGVQVDGELLEAGLEVDPGLEVRDVERLADGLDVGAEHRIRRPENRLDALLHLLARCEK